MIELSRPAYKKSIIVYPVLAQMISRLQQAFSLHAWHISVVSHALVICLICRLTPLGHTQAHNITITYKQMILLDAFILLHGYTSEITQYTPTEVYEKVNSFLT